MPGAASPRHGPRSLEWWPTAVPRPRSSWPTPASPSRRSSASSRTATRTSTSTPPCGHRWTSSPSSPRWRRTGPLGLGPPLRPPARRAGGAARLMDRLGLEDELVRAIIGGTVMGLFEGRRPERLSPPVHGPNLTISYDRMRIYGYLRLRRAPGLDGAGRLRRPHGPGPGRLQRRRRGAGARWPPLIAGVQALWLRSPRDRRRGSPPDRGPRGRSGSSSGPRCTRSSGALPQ